MGWATDRTAMQVGWNTREADFTAKTNALRGDQIDARIAQMRAQARRSSRQDSRSDGLAPGSVSSICTQGRPSGSIASRPPRATAPRKLACSNARRVSRSSRCASPAGPTTQESHKRSGAWPASSSRPAKAKPSMAELSCGGTEIGETTSSARMRSSACIGETASRSRTGCTSWARKALTWAAESACGS